MFPLHGQKNYNGSQQEPKLFGYQYDLKYLLFVSQKKVIQVWNGMILNTILSFVWNILRIFFFLKNKHFVIIYTPSCHSKPDIVKKVCFCSYTECKRDQMLFELKCFSCVSQEKEMQVCNDMKVYK